jgi:hypothetical protein
MALNTHKDVRTVHSWTFLFGVSRSHICGHETHKGPETLTQITLKDIFHPAVYNNIE